MIIAHHCKTLDSLMSDMWINKTFSIATLENIIDKVKIIEHQRLELQLHQILKDFIFYLNCLLISNLLHNE